MVIVVLTEQGLGEVAVGELLAQSAGDDPDNSAEARPRLREGPRAEGAWG
ncbi:MAG TPA: hypothetical protein VM686_31775 [Polyangiaceae bacterium]|nr:hypothetical protein [Polyangiaceae bacterium]